MPIEVDFLLWLHGYASQSLDALFLVSHYVGGTRAWVGIVTLAVIYCAVRGQRRLALVWLVLGLSVDGIQLGLKALFERSRPALWDGPVHHATGSMPSGHALAGAAFYLFVAHLVARRSPRRASFAYGAGAACAFYVGFGRLYLGVHWPTDVVVGWIVGGGLGWLAIAALERGVAVVAEGDSLPDREVRPSATESDVG